MALIKIDMKKERKLRMRKDCVRDIIQLDRFSHCYGLVRDNNEKDRDGDYYNDESKEHNQSPPCREHYPDEQHFCKNG